MRLFLLANEGSSELEPGVEAEDEDHGVDYLEDEENRVSMSVTRSSRCNIEFCNLDISEVIPACNDDIIE